MPAPPAAALAAILSGQSTITRRCEIYESDGVTPWAPAHIPRMVQGKVNVDSSRDERRNLDITLDNKDGLIQHNPNGGLWYDKVIKVFRGVRYANTQTQPYIAVVEATIGSSPLPAYLASIGFTSIQTFDSTATLDDLIAFDIIAASYEGSSDITGTISTLLQQAYAAGKDVLTVSPFSVAATVPLIGTLVNLGTLTATSEWDISHSSLGQPFADFNGYEVNTTGNPAYTLPATASAGSQIGAQTVLHNHSTTFAGIAVLYEVSSSNSAKWVHYHVPLIDVKPGSTMNVTYFDWHHQRDVLFDSLIDWLYSYTPELEWETQIGEFLIDNINMPRAPRTVSVTCRDATKKLMSSKFDNALTFAPGISVDALVRDIAQNAGIFKFKFNTQGAIVSSEQSFDGTTTRWDAIKQICNSYNFDVFFDAWGYLVVRPFMDPSTSEVTLVLKTGHPDGNLVDYSESSSDSEVYNRFVVSGTSPDDESLGNIYQAVAENHEPSSPTSIERLGYVKTYFFSSTFFTSNAQCQAYANSLMLIHSLESFDLSYTSIVFAWLEAGEILQFDAPEAQAGTPNRFLSTSFDIPLTLDAMTGSGKRITIVG